MIQTALIAAALVVAVLAAYALRYRAPYRARRVVIVHTRDGESLRGAVGGAWPGAIVLRAASRLGDQTTGEPDVPVGDVIIERTNVSFVQRV